MPESNQMTNGSISTPQQQKHSVKRAANWKKDKASSEASGSTVAAPPGGKKWVIKNDPTPPKVEVKNETSKKPKEKKTSAKSYGIHGPAHVTNNPMIELTKPHGHPILAAARRVAEDQMRYDIIQILTTKVKPVFYDVGSGVGGLCRALKSLEFDDTKGITHHCSFPVCSFGDNNRYAQFKAKNLANINLLTATNGPILGKLNYCHHMAKDCTCLSRWYSSSNVQFMLTHSIYYLEPADWQVLVSLGETSIHTALHKPNLQQPYLPTRDNAEFKWEVVPGVVSSFGDRTVRMIPTAGGGTVYTHSEMTEVAKGGKVVRNLLPRGKYTFRRFNVPKKCVHAMWYFAFVLSFICVANCLKMFFCAYPLYFLWKVWKGRYHVTIMYFPYNQVAHLGCENTHLYNVLVTPGRHKVFPNLIADIPPQSSVTKIAEIMSFTRKVHDTLDENTKEHLYQVASVMRVSGVECKTAQTAVLDALNQRDEIVNAFESLNRHAMIKPSRRSWHFKCGMDLVSIPKRFFKMVLICLLLITAFLVFVSVLEILLMWILGIKFGNQQGPAIAETCAEMALSFLAGPLGMGIL